jgi:hypothetical protein
MKSKEEVASTAVHNAFECFSKPPCKQCQDVIRTLGEIKSVKKREEAYDLIAKLNAILKPKKKAKKRVK